MSAESLLYPRRRLLLFTIIAAVWMTRSCGHTSSQPTGCVTPQRSLEQILTGEILWEPEHHLKNLTDGQESWEAKLLAVARDSLEKMCRRHTTRYAEKYLKLMMLPKFDGHRIMILSNRVFVANDLLKIEKARKFARTLAQIAQEYKLPNAVWLHVTNSKGDMDQIEMNSLPVTVIARHYKAIGLMVPNPYFGNGDLMRTWDHERKVFERYRIENNWEQRNPRVFWRGSVGERRDCEGFGNFVRLQAMSLTACQPHYFDVKCLRGCGNRTSLTFACDTLYPADPDVAFAINHRLDTFVTSNFTRPTSYTQYQFLLNLPGRTQGSYSRNLNHLWAMGSVILLWDSPYIEWYYAALRSGKTHFTVNKSTILPVVMRIREDPELVKKLIQFSLEVDRHLVCSKCQAKYLADVVHLMHSYFRWGKILKSLPQIQDLLFNYTKADKENCTEHKPRFHEIYHSQDDVVRRPISCQFTNLFDSTD